MLSGKSSSVSCCWQEGQTSAAESILVAAQVTGPRRRSWQKSGMEKLCVAASCAEMTPGQWRSCEHGSGGWWLQPSIAGGCAEEAGKYRCDYGDQLARHTYSPAPRAGKSARTLMSTETWQLARKHFGLGPSVPCSAKPAATGPQPAWLKHSGRTNTRSEELTLFLVSLHVFLDKAGKTIIFQKNIVL